MSQSDDVRNETRTIRVAALTYFKLVELAGIMSIISGRNYSISEIANNIIYYTYTEVYPELVKLVNNPKQLQTVRAQFAKNQEYVTQLWKDVRITE